HPIARGITPGSGPAHLALFGYDPMQFQIGRGVLEALGINFPMTCRHIAARANFATMDKDGVIKDRRAGRIPTDENIRITKKIQAAVTEIDGVKVIIKNGKEHRFVVIIEGDGLADGVNETDPQKEGLKAHKVEALRPEAKKTAEILNKLVAKINETIKDEPRANTFLLRGIASCPDIPALKDVCRMSTACIANYPMYKGLARLVGMDILDAGDTIKSEFDLLEQNVSKYDFFYMHIKKTDSYGEDGNFDAKVHIIEEVDAEIPRLKKMGFDVIAVTGDHCTPAVIKGHGWQPNPFLLVSKFSFPDGLSYTERNCAKGGLGQMFSAEAMPLMLGNSGRMDKYGA
ncbi:MAG: 2,3-bisphosphoglycerate-independent phosphoglycerate mutase, partial [Candidatus Firestonebacteria bacterium]